MQVISGGQTGADQGGLWAARSLDLPTGGWAPKGWMTDAGPAPWLADYGLKESAFPNYRIRTIQNVEMAHAIVWFGHPESPGGILTLGTATSKGVPYVVLEWPTKDALREDLVHARFLYDWLHHPDGTWRVDILMVAGNRERTNPGIETYVKTVMVGALK